MVDYPDSDADTLSLVRALTLYEDSTDEVTQSELQTHLRVAKMRLKTKTDSDSFYVDDGLGQALVATTAIVAKAAIENYSVDSWDLGAGSIDVSGAGDTDNAQFNEWAQMAAEGIASSSTVTKTRSATNINSANYIG